ncbi:unnamed protein product, partial [Mesorhabditis belari]|uniref:SNF2 N-terminal domain-containing protein n=1 Tax=Mesorhabditis belari TaxID=2138241 RepID=A0AAF3FJZ6_9BILA
MGLGKTIQVITFSELFFRATETRKILVVVPINTIQNWYAEYREVDARANIMRMENRSENSKCSFSAMRSKELNKGQNDRFNKENFAFGRLASRWWCASHRIRNVPTHSPQFDKTQKGEKEQNEVKLIDFKSTKREREPR